MEILPKFNIGDTVWLSDTHIERKQRDCPDCLNTRKWHVISPAGVEYDFACPRCKSGYKSYTDISLDYSEATPIVRKLTIGSVQFNSLEKSRFKYMCVETGVGSGYVYDEERLFPTEEQAEYDARVRAAASNVNIEWVAETMKRTAEFCDYELTNARIKDVGYKLTSYRVKLLNLFDDIRDCETIEEVQKIIDEFSF